MKDKKAVLLSALFIIAVFILVGCKKQQPDNPNEPPTSLSGKETQSSEITNQSDPEETTLSKDTADAKDKDKANPDSEEPGVHWFTDYEKAKARAAREGKDLLLNFSGSDWCYWCIKLDKEVFSKEAFAKEAEKYFVFMLVDFPQDTSTLSTEVRKQNNRLAQLYGFRGFFPTIYLATADGKPYAVAEYQEGGPQAYLEYLLEIRKQKNR